MAYVIVDLPLAGKAPALFPDSSIFLTQPFFFHHDMDVSRQNWALASHVSQAMKYLRSSINMLEQDEGEMKTAVSPHMAWVGRYKLCSPRVRLPLYFFVVSWASASVAIQWVG